MSTEALSISFSIAKNDEEFEQIIYLQKQNHFSSLSDELLADHGFVYAEHSLPVLKSMAARLPQVIALYNKCVVGYNLAMSPGMKDMLLSLAPMFDEFDKCTYKNKPLSDYKFIVGGQVCVDENFRGLGLMSKLYHETASHLRKEFELCVTEISTRNTKSLNAHQKMGFEVIAGYHDGNEDWNIVAWKL